MRNKLRLEKIMGHISLTQLAWAKCVNLIFVLSTTFLCSCSLYLDHKENEMREQFSEHSDTFVQLEHLLLKDVTIYRMSSSCISIDEVGEGLLFENSGISQSKLHNYLTLFRLGGIEGGFQRMMTNDNSRRIEFRHENSNFGFTYRESIPVRQFKSFNECRAIKFDDKYRCYVFLKKNWYMHMGTINEYEQLKN